MVVSGTEKLILDFNFNCHMWLVGMALHSTVLEHGEACTKVLRQEEVFQVQRTEWSPQQRAQGGKR